MLSPTVIAATVYVKFTTFIKLYRGIWEAVALEIYEQIYTNPLSQQPYSNIN